MTTNAQAGPNVVDLIGVSAALDTLTGLKADPQEATAAGFDASMIPTAETKLRNAFNHLKRSSGASDSLNRAMDIFKQAGKALTLLEKPPSLAAMARPAAPVSSHGLCTIELTAEEARLYNLCAAQAQLRQGLETRVLRTCQSCQHQKIINPAFEKMQKEQKKLNNWMMFQRNMWVAMSKAKNDPDFVCSRCQGLQATERTIVLCPHCGTPHRGVLLGSCSKCKRELVAQPERPTATAPEPATPAAPPPPPPAPPPASNAQPAHSQPVANVAAKKMLTGKCSTCGNTVRVPLDRIPPGGAVRGKCSGCGNDIVVRRPPGGQPPRQSERPSSR